MGSTVEKTKLEKYMPMILNHKAKAKELGLKDIVKLDDDLLKELKGQGENFDDTKLEVLNHSMHRLDMMISIDEYIGDNPVGLEEAIKLAQQGKLVLFISPTGTGKAFSTNKLMKELNISSLTILPNAAIAEQQGENFQTLSSYGKIKDNPNRSLTYCLEHSDTVFCTWNKFINLCKDKEFVRENKDKLKDLIIILDESHEIYSNGFRVDKAREVIKAIKSGLFKSVIATTATPTREDFEIYDNVIEYKANSDKKYSIKLYDTVSDEYMLDYINETYIGKTEARFAIFEDNIEHLEYYKSKIKAKTDVVHSKNKEESKLYTSLMKKGTMGKYKAVLHTSALVAGYNNTDKDVKDVFLINIKDPSKIRQICARYREVEGLTIHIFNVYPKKQPKTYSIENCIAYKIKDTENRVQGYNRDIEMYGIDFFMGGHYSTVKNDKSIYFDETTNRFAVDAVAIRTDVFDNYYAFRSRKQLEVLLREYFTDIEYINLKEDETLNQKNSEKADFIKEMTKEGKAIIEDMEKYMNILPLAYKISTRNELTREQQAYLARVGHTAEGLFGVYKELGIDKKLEESPVFNQQNRAYTDYVIDKFIENMLAWRLACLEEKDIERLMEKIDLLIYMSYREENLDEAKKEELVSIAARRIGYILDLGLECKWLTKEHYKMIYEDYKKNNKTDINVKQKDIKDLIEGIYVVVRSSVRKDVNFFGGKTPDFKGKDRITAYNCKQKTTPESVANEFSLPLESKSLNDLVTGKKSIR